MPLNSPFDVCLCRWTVSQVRKTAKGIRRGNKNNPFFSHEGQSLIRNLQAMNNCRYPGIDRIPDPVISINMTKRIQSTLFCISNDTCKLVPFEPSGGHPGCFRLKDPGIYDLEILCPQ